MKSLRLIVILLFASLPISCAGPVPAPQPTPDVNVIVAQTMAARTANAPASTPSPNASTPLNTSLLPRSLYFLAPDAAAHAQVFRLARDGKNQVQLTTEPADVTACDVNQNDGRIVYVSNNQMWQGGQAEVVYLDGQPRVTLLPFAREMRWGL